MIKWITQALYKAWLLFLKTSWWLNPNNQPESRALARTSFTLPHVSSWSYSRAIGRCRAQAYFMCVKGSTNPYDEMMINVCLWTLVKELSASGTFSLKRLLWYFVSGTFALFLWTFISGTLPPKLLFRHNTHYMLFICLGINLAIFLNVKILHSSLSPCYSETPQAAFRLQLQQKATGGCWRNEYL